VDFWCRKHLGVRVLDVGTGSGVLARIARARGASMVVGTDIDTGALFAARANAQLDSGAGIIFSDLEPDHWGATFDLVVANILAEPLQMLKFSLLSALAPGGTLILSGFTRLQIPGIRAAFEHIGLIFAQESLLGEWAMLMFKRNRNPASSPPLHYARDSGA
jgi:ribosomal protein L11 methyltransferase